MKNVSIIGAGVVGSAVGRLLHEKGYTIKSVVSRNINNAKAAASFIGEGEPGTDSVSATKAADWVFITTPDKAIKEACDKVASGGGFGKGQLVVHMSGALGVDVLESAKNAGAAVASLHPIQSLAAPEQAVKNLKGSYIGLECAAEYSDECGLIIEALGGRPLVLPAGEKALYHAGCAVASNYLVTVVDFAVTIFESLGMGREEALDALLPLIRGSVENISKVGVPMALTGPIARGDIATVEGHLEALSRKLPGLTGLYRTLGEHAVAVGVAKGTLREEDAERLLKLLA
ncbi:MAG TPA: DUF2520 domain-containing protein [Nitrospirota bacterium]|jgi:predicted short-subunit dehydrogenase-like oxidoreductase (DUF2520 family)